MIELLEKTETKLYNLLISPIILAAIIILMLSIAAGMTVNEDWLEGQNVNTSKNFTWLHTGLKGNTGENLEFFQDVRKSENAGATTTKQFSMGFRVNGVRNLIETETRSVGRTIYSLFSDQPKYDESLFTPSKSAVLLSPEVDAEGYWVGGASPFYDKETDEVYIYYRLRDPYKRGWKSVIARVDGEELEKVTEFYSDEFSAHSLEGGALKKKNGKYVLYISYHEKSTGRWKIDRITAEKIEDLGAGGRKALEIPSEKSHAKDPIIDNGSLIVRTASKNFFDLSNLELREPYNESEKEEILFSKGTSRGRITSVLDIGNESFYFYDWRPSLIFSGEGRAKIGKMKDGRVEGLMPDSAIGSSYGTGSLRYVKTMRRGDEIWFFYERSMPGEGHELCVQKMMSDDVEDGLEAISK